MNQQADFNIRITADAAQVRAAFGQVDEAMNRTRQATARFVDGTRAGTAAVGNLTAQFNDVGVMLASGQNPLTLAIQQGTQISQVLGGQGAAGAARMLGQGLLALISPVNLLSIGLIALGAVAFQKLRAMAGETKTVEDAIKDLEGAVSTLQAVSAINLDDIRRKFGAITPEVQTLLDSIRELAEVQVRLSADGAIQSLRREVTGGFFESLVRNDAGSAASFLGVPQVVDAESPSTRFSARRTNPLVSDLLRELDALDANPTLEDQADGWARIAALIREAAGGVENFNADQATAFQQATKLEEATRNLMAILDGSAERERVLSEYAERSAKILELEQDRVVAVAALGDAHAAADAAAAVRAEEAVAAIDAEIAKTTEADDRLAAMRQTVEGLAIAMDVVEFDGEGAVRDRLQEAADLIADAQAGLVDLNDADLSSLESQLRGIVGLFDGLASGIGATFREIMSGMSLDGASQDIAREIAGMGAGASAALIRNREGFRASAYWDVDAWRAGYGSDTYVDGQGRVRDVTEQTIVTVEQANRDLMRRIAEFQQGIIDLIGPERWAQFDPARQAALTSIAYNYGTIGRVGNRGAGIADVVRDGTISEIAAAIRSLASDNGGVNAQRRALEASIFATGTSESAALAQAERDAADAARQAEQLARESEAARRAEAQAVEAAATAYNGLISSLDEAQARQIAMAEGQKVIDDALARGIITTEEAARALDLLAARFSEVEVETGAAGEAWNRFADDVASAGAAAIVRGQSLRDSLRNIFNGIAEDILRSGIRGALEWALNPRGDGGWIGTLLGAATGTIPSVGAGSLVAVTGQSAGGGRITGPRLVGELGPEVFIPDGPGTIIPNSRLPSFVTAAERIGGIAGMTINMPVDARGADPSVLPRLYAALAQFRSEIPGMIAAQNANPYVRRA